MNNKKIVAFDLDGTLALSKSTISPEMGTALKNLLEKYQVCIISGGNYEQFETQVITKMPADSKFEKLHIMPTCSTQYFRYIDGEWKCVHIKPIEKELVDKAKRVIEQSAKELGYWEENTWGDRIEDRTTQITFSALGQKAPVDEKLKWDPTGEKKEKLRDLIASRLPELESRGGGSTSIDITDIGIDKAFGMETLMKATDTEKSDIVFIGDRLDEHGNDYPVKAMGIDTIATSGPEDTIEIINDLLK